MSSYYICAAITAASALTSLGFSVAAFLAATEASNVNASYAAARSAALALTSLIPFFYASTALLAGIAAAMSIVQGLDAIVGFGRRDLVKTYGPAITAVVNLIALVWLR